VDICKTGTIACPANNPICDDTSIVGAEIKSARARFQGPEARDDPLLGSRRQRPSGCGASYRVTVS